MFQLPKLKDIRKSASIKLRTVITLTLCYSLAFAQPQKELRAIIEVAGIDSGALLGYDVKGIGDVNKDGYADVAISAPGKFLTYVYYGGKKMSQIPSLAFMGGGTIASGDFNGDGWVDLAIEKWSRDSVQVYFGGKNIDAIPDCIFIGEHASDGYGRIMAVGDINGDGFDDLVISAPNYPHGETEFPRGKVYVYGGGPQLDSTPRMSFVGDSQRVIIGSDLAVGDINGDGKKDVVALGFNELSDSGDKQFFYFSVFLGGAAFQSQRRYTIASPKIPGGFKDHIACFDADGDSIDDILINRVCIFKGGKNFDTLPTYYVAPPNNDSSNFGIYPWISGGGDFNRDGVKDLILSRTEGYYGGVPGFYVYLNRLNRPAYYAAYRIYSDHWWKAPLYGRPQSAGDVNGDGVDDIIIGSSTAFLKNEGFFGIYTGDTTLVAKDEGKQTKKSKTHKLKHNRKHVSSAKILGNAR